MRTTQAATAFNERLAYWTKQGLSGAALFEALANDDQLPAFFDDNDIAAIEGVAPLSVKQRRYRKAGPAYVRLSWKAVRYPRPDYIRNLASKFVRAAA